VDAGKFWLFALGVIANSILPVATAIVTGLLVGSIPAAVTAGFDSVAGRATLNLLAATAGLVVLLRVVNTRCKSPWQRRSAGR
jgi:ATP-binding cassette subfamily B protein